MWKGERKMVFYYAMFAIFFVLVSLLFYSGKGFEYIPGWKQTSPEIKRSINIKALKNNMGMMFLALALIFGVSVFSEIFREKVFIWASILWIIAARININYISRSKKFQNKSVEPFDGRD
ncbi:DUF3784 domain-containing protein [Erysipelothrix sp. HDW6C]|uniref:DUF3784 domain-containing protein n=1 Tax=Erysipelothrix sp. HDW6C TaxID=2714930 RepID=UPI00140E049C|nr:DUF3784 domain-containing protein [Erysipelothrix sp. HDW6C]QIK69546.1 DUF3784 domain-containing protein [Erysipelothrix sp. HDW6C]